VADEILVEVKECQTKLDRATADLGLLRSEDGPANKRALEELQTEVGNLRVELRSLMEELRQSRSPSGSPATPSLTPSGSPTPEPEIVNPVSAGGENQSPPKEKKRYRI